MQTLFEFVSTQCIPHWFQNSLNILTALKTAQQPKNPNFVVGWWISQIIDYLYTIFRKAQLIKKGSPIKISLVHLKPCFGTSLLTLCPPQSRSPFSSCLLVVVVVVVLWPQVRMRLEQKGADMLPSNQWWARGAWHPSLARSGCVAGVNHHSLILTLHLKQNKFLSKSTEMVFSFSSLGSEHQHSSQKTAIHGVHFCFWSPKIVKNNRALGAPGAIETGYGAPDSCPN